MPNKKVYNKMVDNILSSRSLREVKQSLWAIFFDPKKKTYSNTGTNLNVLIITLPCGGFGDIIFSVKLAKYILQWYGVNLKIATTVPEEFLKIGVTANYVVELTGGDRKMCRRARNLKFKKKIPEQDLILVAPLPTDFKPNMNDIKALLPYANIMNTFFFSEYNDKLNKGMTFNTGIGDGRDGLFLGKITSEIKNPPKIKNPYALVYVAERPLVGKCVLSFIHMIAKKYHNKSGYENLDVLVPPWFESINIDTKLEKYVGKYYPNIILKTGKGDDFVISRGSKLDNTLTIRCNVLYVSIDKMVFLIKSSIKDILLTGDQSMTDVLTCCPKKNIFYQIVPWKENFAHQMAKLMPNRFLKTVSTSCGTIKAIHYNSDYENFIKKWDFRKRGRNKLDAVIKSAVAIQNDIEIATLVDIVSSTKSMRIIKSRLRKYIEL